MGEILILMVVLQALRQLMEMLFGSIASAGIFQSKMVTMGAMIVLWLLVLTYARFRKVKLPFFPECFTRRYVIVTVIGAALMLSSPSNYTVGFTAVMEQIYGSIVTPVYEETVFRGYIWERLKKTGSGAVARSDGTAAAGAVPNNETKVYVMTSVLFALWHIGYMIPNVMAGDWFAVLTKLIAGAMYGFILGYIRLKSKNYYLSTVVHGIMNIFMI